MPSLVQLRVDNKDLQDRADIMKSWQVYHKVARSLAQGERLANLSWRLWSLRSGPDPLREVQFPSGLLDTLELPTTVISNLRKRECLLTPDLTDISQPQTDAEMDVDSPQPSTRAPSMEATTLAASISRKRPSPLSRQSRKRVKTSAPVKVEQSDAEEDELMDEDVDAIEEEESGKSKKDAKRNGGATGALLDGKKCANCGATRTPCWRKGINGEDNCNACGIYSRLRGRPRPIKLDVLQRNEKEEEEESEDSVDQPECYNCKVRQTPLWRKDSQGHTLCNACGLYSKSRNASRPLGSKPAPVPAAVTKARPAVRRQGTTSSAGSRRKSNRRVTKIEEDYYEDDEDESASPEPITPALTEAEDVPVYNYHRSSRKPTQYFTFGGVPAVQNHHSSSWSSEVPVPSIVYPEFDFGGSGTRSPPSYQPLPASYSSYFPSMASDFSSRYASSNLRGGSASGPSYDATAEMYTAASILSSFPHSHVRGD